MIHWVERVACWVADEISESKNKIRRSLELESLIRAHFGQKRNTHRHCLLGEFDADISQEQDYFRI